MKDWWVKFGCFLTGYNYNIVRNSSEVTVKAVKKYLSALLIISGVWGFIGFSFTERYLKAGLIGSTIGAILLIILVIQIERQIILSVGKNPYAASFRVIIGIVMAILGSVIIDQIIFKDDVEKERISAIQDEVSRLLPIKTKEIKNQIAEIDALVAAKELERLQVSNEVTLRPTISTPTSTGKYEKDSLGRMILVGQEVTNSSILNPKAELIPQINSRIKTLDSTKNEKEKAILNMQGDLEKDLESKIGFLDEIKTLFSIILNSGVALFVWLLWFTFFLAIELFVLVTKLFDTANDYDKTITHQMNMRLRMLEELTNGNKN